MIAQEIVNRFAIQNEDIDKVWKRMGMDINQEPNMERGCTAMPFLMTRYY
jgi:hypothetical protein